MRTSEKFLLLLFSLLLVAKIHGSYTKIQGTNREERHGSTNETERQPYVVYMGAAPENEVAAQNHHHNLLVKAIGDENVARQSRFHSYGKSLNGFAAMLLPHEAELLEDKEVVVSVFKSKRLKVQTSRSWDFVGMPLTVKRNNQIESNMIVGLIDTGLWAESPSFSDEGFGPPPGKWKGKCIEGVNFTGCNNKVIGARYFCLDPYKNVTEPSVADEEGHGTHTASTAAGNSVAGASLYGFAEGTIRGGVPSARIAMYKVCWYGYCSDVDILAAFDQAIEDGVDIISISLGGRLYYYDYDSIAIGSFHAQMKGIFTAASAGNSGPFLGTVANVAPWILTVAANNMDRMFRTLVKLEDGSTTFGTSINTFIPTQQMYPLTSGSLAMNKSATDLGWASTCDSGTMDGSKVKGKIVYCQAGGEKEDYTIGMLGGVGTIISLFEDDGYQDTAFTFSIPAAYVDYNTSEMIDLYINTTQNPQAVIERSEQIHVPAPFVASFSSRGPNLVTYNVLKPDISAPGVDILAAFSKLASVTGLPNDKRFPGYNIISGTSMSAPHAAAAAAYVKSFHPDWSPSAIKSALMTTASVIANREDWPFDAMGYGSGQIDPVKAVYPGLIYDMNITSYLSFLCTDGYNSTHGYNSAQISLIAGKNYSCEDLPKAKSFEGLNYPTMHVFLPLTNSSISAIFERTVTNVGLPKSVYKAAVTAPDGFTVTVTPDTLAFDQLNQTKSFKVVLKGDPIPGNETQVLSASLVWSDLIHRVRSPIVVLKPHSDYP